MKKILFLLLPLIPALALAQTGTVKDSVRVLTTAEIQAGQASDTANFYFIQNGQWRKINMDSLDSFLRRKRAGDRGDIDVSTDGLTWTVDTNAIVAVDIQNGAVDSTKLALGAVVLPGAKVTGTLPVSKGGTGSETQNFVDLTTTQSIGGVKTFTSELTATRFNPTANTATGTGMFLPAANTLAFSTNGTEKVQITSAGNVGIGMTSITAKLDVNGNINFKNNLSGEITSSGAQIVFYNNANQPFWINMNNNNNTGRFICGVEGPANTTFTGSSANSAFFGSNAGDLHILSNGSIQQTIKSTGNIGIGTATPAVQFHTTGGVRFAGLATSGTSTYTVKADATGNLWYDSSDESYKKNISAIPYGIAAVMQLNPVAYNFVEDDEPDLGFIAQDIYNIIPELTYTAQDGKFGVKYDKLVSVLTKAIQEQQAQIEQLKQRITQLENK